MLLDIDFIARPRIFFPLILMPDIFAVCFPLYSISINAVFNFWTLIVSGVTY